MNWTLKVVLYSTLVGITIFCLGVFVWAQQYEGRLPPRTQIDGVLVGGMDPEQVRQALQARIDTILTDGVEIVVEQQQRRLALSTVSASELTEDAEFKLGELLETLMAAHAENPLLDTWNMFVSALQTTSVSIPVSLNRERIQTNVSSLFPEAETMTQEPRFQIAWLPERKMWSIQLNDGTAGKEFEWNAFFETLERQLMNLQTRPIHLELTPRTPMTFTQDEKQVLSSKVATAVQGAPYKVFFGEQTWWLTSDDLAGMLAPTENLNLTLLEEPLQVWVSAIASEVNQQARDARLTIEEGRVKDFVESLEGRTLKEDRLKEALISLVARVQEAPLDPIQLMIEITYPTTTTSDVNDLGIDDVLGVGTSSYKGSPTNRRGNIQNGVDLLNGLLIAPGETFSLLSALSPFTYENGYLPELVIKGDKITPEIGGGLCQIGTTTFRAAMNTGLPIVERQNHSLVVSYYNDPSNGNPGTDATIYEPAPDFKFHNDTGHYILFQAENLTDTQELRFTFWGTRDGREGSYSPPVVSRWIPVGETQYIETLDLEPGVEQCQGSHIGADASFVYTVMGATGETIETLFESHYRPLPRICLVGVEELTEETEGTPPVEELPTATEE
ncbi:VanW family protein [Candidatus Uhrbacteria bacterium]|nr:VanW family protein [Candidatus Uhrbacteria bacterium]